jgi:hypothetical protein
MPLVSSGVEKGNLRELALARMGDLGLHCRDVRTREAGIQDIHHKVSFTFCSCSFLLVYSPAGGPNIPPTSGFSFFVSMPEKRSLLLVLSWCAVSHAEAVSCGMATIQAIYHQVSLACCSCCPCHLCLLPTVGQVKLGFVFNMHFPWFVKKGVYEHCC